MFGPRKGFRESLSLHWLVFKSLPLKIICESHVFAVSCSELDSHCCPSVYRIDAERLLYDRSVSNSHLLGIIKQLLSPFVCVFVSCPSCWFLWPFAVPASFVPTCCPLKGWERLVVSEWLPAVVCVF